MTTPRRSPSARYARRWARVHQRRAAVAARATADLDHLRDRVELDALTSRRSRVDAAIEGITSTEAAAVMGGQRLLSRLQDARERLVRTTQERLARLGAVLNTVAARSQIIVLTCMPERYRGIGSADVVHLRPSAIPLSDLGAAAEDDDR